MEILELPKLYRHAYLNTLSRQRCLWTTAIIALSQVPILFSFALGAAAPLWTDIGIKFSALYLSFGILLSFGIFLMRLYRSKQEFTMISYRDFGMGFWKAWLHACHLIIPILLLGMMLWVILGIFALIQEIPYAGPYLATFLSPGAFLATLSLLLLLVACGLLLYFATPFIALKGTYDLNVIKQSLLQHAKTPLTSLAFFAIACLPVTILGIFAYAAHVLTSKLLCPPSTTCETLQWLFLILPTSLFLSPGILFFFNFAYEANKDMETKIQTSSSSK